MAKRMVGVFKTDNMVLPYGMLLTRLFRHVSSIQPCPVTDYHFLADHFMVPLTEGRAKRITIDGKRPHPPTDLSDEVDPTNEPMENFQLNPIDYVEQLLEVPRASEEFKQTKGMFKCLGHFLSNMGKKKQ